MADMHTPLLIRQIGEINVETDGGEKVVIGVLLEGGVEAVREAAQLFGQPVRLVSARSLSQDAETVKALREALEAIDSLEVMEINPSNYDHEIVCELNSNAVQASLIARAALAGSAS